MAAGVYEIRNLVTGDFYVGESGDMERRMRYHVFLLSRGTHPNKRLQTAWNTYGEAAFYFEEVLIIEDDNHRDFYERGVVEELLPKYNNANTPWDTRLLPRKVS